MKRYIIYLCLVGLLGILLVYNCSKKSNSSYAPTTGGGTTPVATASVSIQSMAFAPGTIYLKVNGTVTWTNNDPVQHTVTDLGGSFNSGLINPNQTYQRSFPNAGTYTYHCTVHPAMANAMIVVGD